MYLTIIFSFLSTKNKNMTEFSHYSILHHTGKTNSSYIISVVNI